MSESNKSKCLFCNQVYRWVGYKTGIGKTPAQLLQMSKDHHTCKYCGSKELVTGLDWTGSMYEENMKALDPEYMDHSILTEYELQRSQKDFKNINAQKYACRHCQSHDLVVISRWEDTDGNWILLYCNECKKRTACARRVDDEQSAEDLPVLQKVEPTIVTKELIDAGEASQDEPTPTLPQQSEWMNEIAQSYLESFGVPAFEAAPTHSQRIYMPEKHSAPNIVTHDPDCLAEDSASDIVFQRPPTTAIPCDEEGISELEEFMESRRYKREVDPVPKFRAVAPLIDSALIHVDPYDETLDEETKHKILVECKRNFWYFVQNIMKVKTTELDVLFINYVREQMDQLNTETNKSTASSPIKDGARRCLSVCLECQNTSAWYDEIDSHVFRDHGECNICGNSHRIIIDCATDRLITDKSIHLFAKGGPLY